MSVFVCVSAYMCACLVYGGILLSLAVSGGLWLYLAVCVWLSVRVSVYIATSAHTAQPGHTAQPVHPASHPASSKKYAIWTTPYWTWGTSGVQSCAFSTFEPHRPPRGVDD